MFRAVVTNFFVTGTRRTNALHRDRIAFTESRVERSDLELVYQSHRCRNDMLRVTYAFRPSFDFSTVRRGLIM